MCDEKKILLLFGGLVAKMNTVVDQHNNIFDRIQKLEQKNPICESHNKIVDDIDNLKSWKNKSIGAISILSIGLAYVIYLISKYIHFPPK